MSKILTGIFFLFSISVFAQGFKKIDCGNPIIGDWQIILDSASQERLTIHDSEMNYIDFSCGEVSTSYPEIDEEKNVILPIYFITTTNGKTIKATIKVSLMEGQEGKTFSFAYKLDGKTDILTIIYEKKKYDYYRLKK